MKIKEVMEAPMYFDMPKGTPGPGRRSEMDITTSIDRELPKLADALRAGKWKYAEALLANMHAHVSKLAAQEEPAPSLERPRFSV